MSVVASGEAPSTSMVRRRKPAAPNRASMREPTPATSRSPRWPVARAAPTASASTTRAPLSASLGESPWASRAEAAVRRAAAFAATGRAALTGGFACRRDPPRTAAGIRILRDPQHQSVEIHALQRRLLWNERSGRHAGLGVHLKEDQNVVNIVITQVRPGHPPAAQGRVRRLARSQRFFKGMGGDFGGNHVHRATLRILGLVVVEGGAREYVGHA